MCGRITSLRYYEDSHKWVFTLAAAGGNFYVECSSPQAAPSLALGSQVMITGSLFSRRTRSGCDSGSICAREVLSESRLFICFGRPPKTPNTPTF